jgi:hypothetical protein
MQPTENQPKLTKKQQNKPEISKQENQTERR